MTTYTIVNDSESGMLLCCLPDGSDLESAISEFTTHANIQSIGIDDCDVNSGLVLTDDTEDGDQIIYGGNDLGWLTDEFGRTYEYAVRRNAS